MDKVRAHDEETHGSGSGSGFSDLSALENETDDFGRRLLQHQRDQQRLNNVLRGSQQASKKAHPRPRAAESIGREEHARQREQDQDHQRTDSAGSNDSSDPPINVPREWGRKGRRQGEWMRKIQAPSEPSVGQAATEEEDAIYPHKTAYTGDEDPSLKRDRSLQSADMQSLSLRRHRTSGTPSSMHHMNTTTSPIDQHDESDFTAASLLASTPATRIPRKIDELTDREIENLEQQAVTSRALDKINEGSPKGTVRRVSSSQLRSGVVTDSLDTLSSSRPATSHGFSTSPSRIPRRRRSLIGNKENVPVNGEAVGNKFKAAETIGVVNRTAPAVNIKKPQRPKHERNDSLSLLRKLARVSSMSPSPAKVHADAFKVEQEGVEGGRQVDMHIDMTPAALRAALGAKRSEAYTKQESEDQAAQDNKAELDIAQQEARSDADTVDVAEDAQAEPKTPIVTGGWIETTFNTDIRPLLKTTDSEVVRAFGSPSGTATLETATDVMDEHLRQIARQTTTSKSALDAIVREARTQGGTQGEIQLFGDSTIMSLEDIAHPDLELTESTFVIVPSAADEILAKDLDNGDISTQAERTRRLELLAIEGMDKHLQAAHTSLKDANRGLRRVENRIETVNTATPALPLPSPIRSTDHKATSHGRGHCDTCGGGYNSVTRALLAEFLSLFYTYDHNSKLRIRLTWLGLACLLWCSWYLSETTLCSYYCHPLYASSMIGYGVDPDAPRFPFVIPTLIFRPLRWLWRPICETLAWGLSALFHTSFGDEASSSEPTPHFQRIVKPALTTRMFADKIVGRGLVATATRASARIARSAIDALDEVGSMWDDEVIL